MESSDIKRYSQKSLPELIHICDRHFNLFIRNRDKEKGCISCSKGKTEHCCHYYSAGNYKALSYNEMNAHGGCAKCNTYLSGNLIESRHGLVKRIGEEEIRKLDVLAALNKRNGFKWDRLSIIEKIIHYRELNK